MISIFQHWRNFIADKGQKQIVVFILIFTTINVLLFTWFLRVNEQRIGVHFSEPLKDYIFPVKDFTWEIFTLTYISIAWGIIVLLRVPLDFLKALCAYNLLLIFRLLSISLIPLEPPADMIPMKDPIIETIAAYDGFIYKDLFFSGHTATLFLLALMMKNKLHKIYFYAVTIIVGFMLVKQQVHFSIDVLAAPVFAYICFYIIEQFWKKKEILLTQFIEEH
jgi:hypothetical protein